MNAINTTIGFVITDETAIWGTLCTLDEAA